MLHSHSANPRLTVYLDQNAPLGGDGTRKAPYCDLEEAFEACKRLLTRPRAVSVTLSIAEGHYALSCEMRLSGGDIAHPQSSFTVEGVAGKTVISSLRPLDASAFERVGENLYAMSLDIPTFRYLYVDGRVAQLSRRGGMHADDRDLNVMRFDRTFDANPREGVNPKAEGKVYLKHDLLIPLLGGKTSGRVSVKGVEWHQEFEWNYNIMHIREIDLDESVTFEEGSVKEKHVACYIDLDEYQHFCGFHAYKLNDRHYFLQNAKAFVDEENAYFFDDEEKKLYYYTEGDVLAHTFAYPQLDRLFFFEGLRDTVFRGITFTGTDDTVLHKYGHSGGQACRDVRLGDFPRQAAIYSEHAYRVSFLDCTFAELGCEGIRINGRAEDIRVEGCTFSGLGCTAIRMNSITSAFDAEHGCLRVHIENNLIEHVGRMYYEAPGIQLASTKDSFIGHNTLRDIAYTGISVGWNWEYHPGPHGEPINIDNVTICYNYITDYMKELGDGGAIYVLGGNAPKEDHTLYNRSFDNVVVFNKTTGCGRFSVFGIYYDGSSTSWHSRNNLVVGQSFGSLPWEDASGERDEHEIKLLRARRAHSIYFFCQRWGTEEANAWSYNIRHENCYFIRPQKKTWEERVKEAHYNTLCEARNVIDVGMTFVDDWEELPRTAEEIIMNAGAPGYAPDLCELKRNRY